MQEYKEIKPDDRTITMEFNHVFRDSEGNEISNRPLTRKELMNILNPVKTKDCVNDMHHS